MLHPGPGLGVMGNRLETAAPDYTLCTDCAVIAVLNPFFDIPIHVVKIPSIRRLSADGSNDEGGAPLSAVVAGSPAS